MREHTYTFRLRALPKPSSGPWSPRTRPAEDDDGEILDRGPLSSANDETFFPR
jgi:hypothetical protein